MKNRASFLVCLAAFLFLLSEVSRPLKLVIFLAGWLGTGGLYWCYLFWNTCGRDFKLFSRGAGFMLKIALVKRRDENVAQIFRKVVARHPDKTMFIDAESGGKTWTYRQVDTYQTNLGSTRKMNDPVLYTMHRWKSTATEWPAIF